MCYTGPHWVLVCVGVPVLCLFFLFSLRLLHAGGNLSNVEMRIGIGATKRRTNKFACISMCWGYDSKKYLSYRHPLSPNSVVHDMLTVIFKCAAVLVSTLFGRKHNTEVAAFMLATSLALAYTTLRWPPHFGTDGSSGKMIVITSNANRARCAMDVALIFMFAYALMASVNHDHGVAVSWWGFLIGIAPMWTFGYFVLPTFVFGWRTLRRFTPPKAAKLCNVCCRRTKKVHPNPALLKDTNRPTSARPRAATIGRLGFQVDQARQGWTGKALSKPTHVDDDGFTAAALEEVSNASPLLPREINTAESAPIEPMEAAMQTATRVRSRALSKHPTHVDDDGFTAAALEEVSNASPLLPREISTAESAPVEPMEAAMQRPPEFVGTEVN
eukprot:COSAG01_NODE_2258_length_8063_cov_10.409216_4_plen_386_part_00